MGFSQETDFEKDALLLGEILLRVYGAGLVQLHSYVPHFVLEVSQRPVASPLARLQIQNCPIVTSLRHANVEIEDPIGGHLLVLLDGTRNRTDLLRELAAFVESGAPFGQLNGGLASPEKNTYEISATKLEENLAKLAHLALLVA